MSIFVLGDIHGAFSILGKVASSIPGGSTLIQVGDFGIGFHSEGMEAHTLAAIDTILRKKSARLLVIRGNHDNPKYWGERNEWWNSQFTHIEFLPDYTYRELGGKLFLFVGGAVSIDRAYRKEGIDWWRGEEFILDLNKVNQRPDVVITHSCPLSVVSYVAGTMPQCSDELKELCKKEQEDIEELWLATKPAQWFFGHWHVNNTIFLDKCRFRCLGIEEVKEIIF
jgi:DNA repair exonuclease SbcCD nuclease subunit